LPAYRAAYASFGKQIREKMAQYTWVSYGGTARIALAVALLAAAAIVAYAGFRLPLPVRPPRRGQAAVALVAGTWVLAIVAFLVCLSVLIQQARQDQLPQSAPADPITPVTYSGVAVIFVIVLLISSSRAWPVRLAGAVIAALAAPMLFELPFDLIVMAKSYPPVTPDPVLYRVLFFAPLFLVEITTLAFLTLSPMVTLRKTAFFSFALMLAVFAVWGLDGFAYPSTPVPFALNVVSKILAFVTALIMFLPERASVGGRPSAPRSDPAPV
jgi:hypothetical protein